MTIVAIYAMDVAFFPQEPIQNVMLLLEIVVVMLLENKIVQSNFMRRVKLITVHSKKK
jgi:hypothetical protein